MREWHYVTDDEPAVTMLDVLTDWLVSTDAGTATGDLTDLNDRPVKTYGVSLVEGRVFGVEFDWHTRDLRTAWCDL